MMERWQLILEKIDLRIGQENFDKWIKPLRLCSATEGSLAIEAPNRFFAEWLKKNYLEIIREEAEQVMGQRPDLKLSFAEGGGQEKRGLSADQGQNGEPVKTKIASSEAPSTFSSKYTFNTFVVGASNQFAHAASMAVCESPGRTYNPLFIYGGVGLGKTHLLHAIGNFVKSKNPLMRTSYVSSEHFVNDLISSIQHDKMVGFRNKYRNMDVLLIDDIQFIAGKDRTQEEFFHTFNTLFESRKQIVISSDRYPKEISALEERLRSRFEWGLIADIQPPDLETKIAILKSKAADRGFDLPNPVALYIADKIKSNVRELEGSLLRVIAVSSLTGAPITIDLVRDTLKGLSDADEKQINIKTIQEAICSNFNIKLFDIKSKKRNRSVTTPRQIAMYLCRKLTNSSLPEIGKQFGGKDHTTVLHSFNKINEMIKSDQKFAALVDKIIKSLTS